MRWTFDGSGSWSAKSKVKDPDGDKCTWEIRVCDDGEFECEIDHPDVLDRPSFNQLSVAKDYCQLTEAKIVREQAEEESHTC
jgi:hypothetical protein